MEENLENSNENNSESIEKKDFDNFCEQVINNEYNHMTAEKEINKLHTLAKKYFMANIEVSNYDVNILENPTNFLLFSIETLLGQILSESVGRSTLYESGLNWQMVNATYKNKISGEQHYNFLNKVSKIGLTTPMDLLKKLYKDNKIKQKCVITFDTEECSDQCSNPDFTVIEIISIEDLKRITGNQKKIFDSFRKIVNIIREYKFIETENNQKIETDKNILKVLKEFKVYLDKHGAELNIPQDMQDKYPLLKVFDCDSDAIVFNILYYINDLYNPDNNYELDPYTLLVYFTKNNQSTPKKLVSFVMWGTRASNNIYEADISDLGKHIRVLEKVASTEITIMKKVENNIGSYVQWHAIYNKESKNYESFLLFIESYITHFCRINKIEYHLIEGRIKTFESFYNKIFIEYNKSLEEIDKEEKKSEDQKDGKKIEDLKDKKDTYLNAIKRPRLNTDKLFKEMNDIAGLRIICYFNGVVGLNSETESLGTKLIGSLKDNKLYLKTEHSKLFYIDKLSENESKVAKEYGIDTKVKDTYRGFHTTIKYEKNDGDENTLFGNFFLTDSSIGLQCEVQLRTVISHGFTEIEHGRYYKTQTDELTGEQKDNMKTQAISLLKADEEVSNLFQKVDNNR